MILYGQDTEKENLLFESFTIEDGLPYNSITDITQDTLGYLWIGTTGGLSRYDGYSFKNFLNDPDDSQSLAGNIVSTVLADQHGEIWVGTAFGVNRYNPETDSFIRYTYAPDDSTSIPNDLIFKIFESSDGTVWIGTSNGLAKYNRANDSFKTWLPDSTNNNSLSHERVFSFAEDENGYVYIGTFGGGVNILNPKTGNFSFLRHDPDDSDSLPNDYIHNLFIDKEQTLWVNYEKTESGASQPPTPGDPSGLWKIDLKSKISKHYLYYPDKGHLGWHRIGDFCQTSDGKLWMVQAGAPENGLRLYDPEEDSFVLYSHDYTNPNSLVWSFATSVFEDRFGILWIGTSRGLSKTGRKQNQFEAFTAVPENPYDSDNLVYRILEIRKNVFWYAGDGGVVKEWNRNTNSWKRINDFHTSQNLGVLNSNNSVWFISRDWKLGRININNYEKNFYEADSEEHPELSVYGLIKHSEENLILQTNEGLWSFDIPSSTYTYLEVQSQYQPEEPFYVSHFTKGKNGTYWLSYNYGRIDSTSTRERIVLANYNLKTGELNYLERDSSYLAALGHGFVNSLMEDSQGNLWIAKSNGLVFYNPGTDEFKYYNQKDGLNHIDVLGTLEDNRGNIWLSTKYGISRFNPETETFRNFGVADGLRPSRMNPYSFFKRKNGEMLFGGVGGINYFHPDSIVDPQDPPVIHISAVEVGGEPINLHEYIAEDKPIPVEWSSNTIDLEFTSVNFRNPEQTTYSYKMEGFYEDWVDTETRRFAQFSNLSPGSYQFKVRATNAEGISSIEEASISIRVLPPLWRTWWAYGFYILLFVGGVFGVDRYQRKRLIKKERERAREKELEQAKEIKKAYYDLEVAHENLKSAQDQLVQQEKLASLGQLTAGIAHEIKNPLNFVNNFSDLSIELVEEARGEVKEKLSADSHQLTAILDDIETNLRKIHKHGNRADGIVKSMLQHSRGGDGKMEPTDLNAIVKEYTNLAFHGMRAGKDPINVDIELDLNDNVGEIPVIAEDFSRVILNICNNAFDAMREKLSDVSSQQSENPEDRYKPKLAIRTLKKGQGVTIKIEDNGPGIPKDIKSKILQPFFTTKKGTQGTGLGLSITNDIINAHGGQIDIESEPGSTCFTITLSK
jgi:signal transduction histidine kinase/ligand-binding sensor domain-containing protein